MWGASSVPSVSHAEPCTVSPALSGPVWLLDSASIARSCFLEVPGDRWERAWHGSVQKLLGPREQRGRLSRGGEAWTQHQCVWNGSRGSVEHLHRPCSQQHAQHLLGSLHRDEGPLVWGNAQVTGRGNEPVSVWRVWYDFCSKRFYAGTRTGL